MGKIEQQFQKIMKYATYTYTQDNLHTNLRLGFVRKVYGILSLQLSATVLICFLANVSRAVQNFIWILQVPMLIAMVVSMLWLSFSKSSSILNTLAAGKQVPLNYILLGTFTLSEACSLALITSMFDYRLVMTAFMMTAGVTIALTVYAMTTKNDVTLRGATGSILLSSFSLLVWLNLFFSSSFLHTLYLMVGVVAYGYYLVYHTQAIVGGKAGEVDMDNYIQAAMTLYVDIIQLFLKLLQILQKLQESEEEKKKNRRN